MIELLFLDFYLFFFFLYRLLRHLVPQIDELTANSPVIDEAQVLEFIRRTTMVGLLPVPHPIGKSSQ